MADDETPEDVFGTPPENRRAEAHPDLDGTLSEDDRKRLQDMWERAYPKQPDNSLFRPMMAPSAPPAPEEIGRITIVVTAGVNSTGPQYVIEGVDMSAAIGYVQCVLDAMRENVKLLWSTPPGVEGRIHQMVYTILALISQHEGGDEA